MLLSRLAAETWRHVAAQSRARWPKLVSLIDDVDGVRHSAYRTYPSQHRAKFLSANPLEGFNKEVKRRADVVGIFPNEQSIVWLIGTVLLKPNDEWQPQHRYIQVQAMAKLDALLTETPALIATPEAAQP